MISFLALQHLLLFQGIFSWWEQAHSAVVFMLKARVEALPSFFFFSRHVFQHVSKGLESAPCVVTCAYLTLLCSPTSFCLQSLGSYLTISKEFWAGVIADPAYCPLPSAKKKAWRSRREKSLFGIFNRLNHVRFELQSSAEKRLQLWLLPEKKIALHTTNAFFMKLIRGKARALQ